jgi:hypothetical protein
MLTISRPDISRSEITEFPVATRFIKLPITNYLKLLPAVDPITREMSTAWDQINRAQIALINAVNNPSYRFICAALARRLGKTYIANVIGQLVMLVPGCNILIISPNYNLSSISFELQRHLIRSFDLEVERDNVKDRVLELKNGSTIRLGSLSTVDSSVGRSYDLIIFDEAALGDGGEEAFNIALRPTLDRPGSKAIFISTPRGKGNWFSRFFDRGFSSDFPEWASITADYTENPRMSEKDVKEARSVMSKAEFEQEYMASFTTFEGQIYQLDEHLKLDYVARDGDEVIAGLDPGYKDPTAFCVIVYSPCDETYHIVDEYQDNQATTAEHVSRFTELIERWQIETIFIDSASAQMAADLAYTYDIATIKAKKSVLDGIALVQTLADQGRIKVSPHCEHTLFMFDQYRWDSKDTVTRERPEHGMASHMADAIRYAMYTYTIGG